MEPYYGVVGVFFGLGLMMALLPRLHPGFRSDRFRALPEADQARRLRRSRIAGAVMAVLAIATVIGGNLLEAHIAELEARDKHPPAPVGAKKHGGEAAAMNAKLHH